MIYITGDTHADFSRFEDDKFPIQFYQSFRPDRYTAIHHNQILDLMHGSNYDDLDTI